jgi:retron-type reverse transcriptase
VEIPKQDGRVRKLGIPTVLRVSSRPAGTKFFNRVSHDRLAAKIAERAGDKRLWKLIRAGTPQGGPLTP